MAALFKDGINESDKETIIAEGYLANMDDLEFFEKTLKDDNSIIILLKASE